MDKTFYQRITEVQCTLNAPKNQFNKFGNYKYRNLEDILEAVKPILREYDILLTLNDDIQIVGEKAYLKSTGKLIDALNPENQLSTTAFVELSEHKGMSPEQALGTASSYCRKYCLGGLLLVDDNKDPDTNEFTQQKQASAKATKATQAAKKVAAKPTEPTDAQKKELIELIKVKELNLNDVLAKHGVTGRMTIEQYNAIHAEISQA